MQHDTPPRIVDFLSDDQRRDLEALGTPVTYPVGDTVFREGQPSRSVVVIKSGGVKITRQDRDGTEVFLATRGVGEVLGDEGVLLNALRSATVTVVSELVGVDIGANELLEFVEREHLWPLMYRATTYRRRESDDYRTVTARLDVPQRLVSLLLAQARSIGVPDGDTLVIDGAFSQQELADSIGASREAVAVELRKLREEGLVTTARRRLVLHNMAALRQVLMK